MSRPLALLPFAAVAVLALAAPPAAPADAASDRAEVARLDTEYQAAVKANDAAAMERILHPAMILVTGVGKAWTREQIVQAARDRVVTYQHQEEVEGTQTVRLYGDDTAVVTALLWIAMTPREGGDPVEYKLWFSDTYVRTAEGWKYAFGQAAQRLAPES